MIADYDKKINSLESAIDAEIKKNQELGDRVDALEKRGRRMETPLRRQLRACSYSYANV